MWNYQRKCSFQITKKSEISSLYFWVQCLPIYLNKTLPINLTALNPHISFCCLSYYAWRPAHLKISLLLQRGIDWASSLYILNYTPHKVGEIFSAQSDAIVLADGPETQSQSLLGSISNLNRFPSSKNKNKKSVSRYGTWWSLKLTVFRKASFSGLFLSFLYLDGWITFYLLNTWVAIVAYWSDCTVGSA